MENLSSRFSETIQEGIEQEGNVLIKASLQKLYSVWEKLNLDPTQKAQRAKLTWTHVNNMLLDILDEKNAVYKDMKDRVHKCSSKLAILSKILRVPAKEVNGSLVRREEILRQELDRLNSLKEKRKQAYENLKNKVVKYCRILNINEKCATDPNIPSEEELQCLEHRVLELKDEKEKRGRKFLELKKELTTILETTKLPSEMPLEEDILSEKDLSNETFQALEDVIDKAKRKQSELEARKKELMERLTVLWTILKVEDEKKVEFLSKHLDARPSTLESIQEEVDRCKQIRADNLQPFVDALWQDLEELWTKCYVSEHQRRLLRSESNVTEAVLEQLEIEVQKWRRYQDDVVHILQKIDRRQQLFDQMIAFENKSADPNRFRNRKGYLLQEERERKRLQKELPALEDDLFREIKAYEDKNKMPFLYYGGDYQVFVANQWAEHKNKKESNRLDRHKKYLLKMQSELSSGAPVKRPNTRTPQSAPCKLFKPNTGPLDTTPETSSFLKTTPNTVDHLTSKKHCVAQNKGRKFVPRDRNRLIPNMVSPDGTTYSEFADVLQGLSRSRMQSSVLSTKKRGGSRISVNRKKKAVPKQTRRSTRKSATKTTPKLAPMRGKYNLPFLL